MKRIILQACCLLLFSWLFAHRASAQQADSVATLASRIDTLLKYKLPAGAHAGHCIYDLTAGRMLYEYQADKLSRPASTMKVMTAITALSQQGIDEPFRTELWTRGRIVGDTLKGDLYVVGGFDPELDEADHDRPSRLRRRVQEHGNVRAGRRLSRIADSYLHHAERAKRLAGRKGGSLS